MMDYEDLFEYCHAFDNSSIFDVNLSVDNSEVSNFIESLLPNFPINPNAKRKTLDQVVEYLFMIVANIGKAYMQNHDYNGLEIKNEELDRLQKKFYYLHSDTMQHYTPKDYFEVLRMDETLRRLQGR